MTRRVPALKILLRNSSRERDVDLVLYHRVHIRYEARVQIEDEGDEGRPLRCAMHCPIHDLARFALNLLGCFFAQITIRVVEIIFPACLLLAHRSIRSDRRCYSHDGYNSRVGPCLSKRSIVDDYHANN